MSKGIKKIKWSEGNGFSKLSIPNVKIVIPPNEYSWFVVGEWESGTTEADKKKNVTWMRQDHNRKTILNQMTVPYNQKYGFQLPKNLCGSYTYYIEASISGKTSTSLTGLYVGGHCATKIVKTFWTTKQNSLNETENHIFSFGEVIFLQLNTEGLNGDRVIVEIYNKQLFGDKLVRTITQVQVIDGEVNVKISNSYLWKGQLWFTLGVEEFYAKIKNPATGQYISDSTKESSKIFKIKNEIVTKSTDKPTNIVPLKIGKVNVNAERYEPCKFDSITIKEKEKKEGKDVETKIVVFEKGKKLTNVKHPDEDIVKSILFEFDSVIIHPEGQKVLNNVLQFLLEHQHSSISLSGYACVIGKKNYNLPLSKRRADAVKKFLEDGKLDKTRIVSVGNGEAQYKNGALSVQTNDNKNGEDNLKNKDEKINTHARRVDIAFKFYGHDAQTIVYETIAPSVSTKKDLEIEIIGFDTKSCFRSKGKEHKKQTKIIDIGQIADKSDVSKTFSEQKFTTKIYSDLSKFNVFPIQYIWPMATTPNKIYLHTHSCRYFSDDKNATLKVLVYPDIKWKLKFFLNLTNDLSVKWMNMSPDQHKKLQEKAGKIGAERRWKQKDATFGFSLKASWDNDSQEKEFKKEYDTKFKKLYSLFSSIGAMSDGVTSKTKGTMRSISAKGIPVSFIVKPPNLELSGDWFLSHSKDNKQILGTDVTIGLHAKPLIGLDITIDLLGAVVFGAGSIVGAGPGVTKLYQAIQDILKKGIEAGNEKNGLKANVDIYMDLIISNTISIDAEFKFNTSGKAKDSKFEIKAENKLKVELKVGIKIKGEIIVAIFKAEAYFEASASAEASVTFGHGINYDEKGLYYRPKLGFDGLDAKYVIVISASLAMKIAKDKQKAEDSRGGKYEIAKGDFKGVIKPFDVIEELEKQFGMSANIPLIRN